MDAAFVCVFMTGQQLASNLGAGLRLAHAGCAALGRFFLFAFFCWCFLTLGEGALGIVV